jgi:hypothetical protein
VVELLTKITNYQRKEKVTKRKENQQHTHHVKELLTKFVYIMTKLNEVEG